MFHSQISKFQKRIVFFLCSMIGMGIFCAQQQPPFSLNNIQFEQVTDEDGLSNGFVTSIIQDTKGFIWFGTAGGLNRYDGYQFKSWRPEDNNPNSLSQGNIWALYESADGSIWIGTGKGLNRFDPQKETFTRYFHNPDPVNLNSLSNDEINTICEDTNGNLYVGTGNGLSVLQKGSDHFSRYFYEPVNPEGRAVRSVIMDEKGCMWFGSLDTLFCFDPATNNFLPYRLPFSGVPEERSRNYVKTIFLEDSLHLWLSTDFNGIYRFDKQLKVFSLHFEYSTTNANSLSHNRISSFLNDDFGNLWVGTYGGGLNILSPDRKFIQRFIPDPFNPIHQNFEVVRSMLQDKAGNIWLGTFYGGAKVFLKNKKPFINYVPTPGKPGSLKSGSINTLSEIHNGMIWVPVSGNGLALFDSEAEAFSQKNLPNSLMNSNILSVLEESKGDIWAITFNEIWKMSRISNQWKNLRPSGMPKESLWLLSQFKDMQGIHWIGSQGGLFIYDRSANVMMHYPLETNKAGFIHGDNNYIESFFESPNGDLWIATHGGLNRRPTGSKHFDFYPFHQQVLCIHQDKKGTIWLGTLGGLAYFNPEGKVEFHPMAKKLSGKLAHAILEDKQGRLWISSRTGVIRFDPSSGDTRNYNQMDGLVSRQFFGTHLKSKSGEFYFGGTKGLLRFHPDNIHENEFIPEIVLTNFQILNKDVPIRGSPGDTLRWKSPLDKNISYTDTITLLYWQNDFAFEFAALDYTAPLNNQYRFKLEGYDTSPVVTNADRRFAHYTNISPGTYTFKVIGSNNDGRWNNEGVSITIIIRPPWWATWWAYLLYFLVALFILLGIRRYELNRQSAKAEARRLEELDTVKTRLYTNITHEFRTPLTIILGLAEQLKSQASEGMKTGLDMIRRNGQQLLRLVNQMLDLAKVESGHLKLDLVQGDVVNYLQYLLESFQSLAKSKNIRLHFQTKEEKLLMDYDPERLQTIVSNLLSNAIKFTPNGGEVILCVQTAKSPTPQLLIQVRDTGPGIPEDKLPNVFDRFYQADDSATRGAEGTGIGLTLTRELVKLMQGNISVESAPGKGAEFTVVLPVTRTAEKQAVSQVKTGLEHPLEPLPPGKPKVLPAQKSKENPFILIIEDNPDVVRYLQTCLQSDYRFEVAYDGHDGIEKALELVPDLIISDVMMPRKDGFEVCYTLKTDERTSHIPVILLTAKADIESRLTGLRRGADAYLAKPFHKEELLVRIQNLLEVRRKMHAHYLALAGLERSDGSAVAAKASPKEAMEHAFIQKVRALIEEDFSTQWQVKQLADKLFVSTSQLHRKLEALTGMHTTEFVRYVRLNAARERLLAQPEEKVSAIAYDVGFENVNEFNRRFKEVFGVAPGEWRKRSR